MFSFMFASFVAIICIHLYFVFSFGVICLLHSLSLYLYIAVPSSVSLTFSSLCLYNYTYFFLFFYYFLVLQSPATYLVLPSSTFYAYSFLLLIYFLFLTPFIFSFALPLFFCSLAERKNMAPLITSLFHLFFPSCWVHLFFLCFLNLFCKFRLNSWAFELCRGHDSADFINICIIRHYRWTKEHLIPWLMYE